MVNVPEVEFTKSMREALFQLGNVGIATSSILAQKIGQSVQNVSKNLKKLEKLGYVERIDPQKQSWKEYRLTTLGHEYWVNSQGYDRLSNLTNSILIGVTGEKFFKDIDKEGLSRIVLVYMLKLSIDLLWSRDVIIGLVMGDIPKTLLLAHFSTKKRFVAELKEFLARFSRSINGEVFAYHLDTQGYFDGVVQLSKIVTTSSHPLVWISDRPYSALTKDNNVVAIKITSKNQSFRVYFKGEVVMVYRKGEFIMEPYKQLVDSLEGLAKEHSVSLKLLVRFARISLQLSEIEKGSIILIGNVKKILNASRSEYSEDFNLTGMNINTLDDNELLSLAKEDGALVFDRKGKLQGFRVLLKPTSETKIPHLRERGMRHRVAAKMSKETDSICFVVSDSGSVTIYSKGKQSYQYL